MRAGCRALLALATALLSIVTPVLPDFRLSTLSVTSRSPMSAAGPPKALAFPR
jgi:hypothetical protein